MTAIILAVIVGNITGTKAGLFGITFFQLYELGGTLFLNALHLLVVPLIASALISSLGKMGGDKSFKMLGLKTFGFYILTISIAVVLGVILVNLIQPGLHHKNLTASLAESTPLTAKLLSQKEAFFQIFNKIIPKNIFEAAAETNMLGVIFFSLLFGFALMKTNNTPLLNFWQGLFTVMMKMTSYVMKVMPFGVFCLVAKVVAAQGMQSVGSLLYFFVTVVLGLLIFGGVALPVLLKIMGVNPFKHIRAMCPALFTAFSTSSSAATLPVTMECVEERAGVSNRICSFVVPLGTSLNMAGSALYECVAVLFIAQIYGIEMSMGQQIVVAILSLLTSMGVAGIPSASLVAVLIILHSLGLPAEGLALILPFDRILDMFRTTTNVLSDATCAVLVARSEGENVYAPNPT